MAQTYESDRANLLNRFKVICPVQPLSQKYIRGGKGQFSVAGNTVIFVAGAMENRICPPERAQADDELVAALGEAATWKRQGDSVSFIGTTTLRFRINTN